MLLFNKNIVLICSDLMLLIVLKINFELASFFAKIITLRYSKTVKTHCMEYPIMMVL